MGGLDGGCGSPPGPAVARIEMAPRDMEYIRRVFDEDAGKRKLNSIFSPREDAQMFRTLEKHSVPCECVVEVYELLWRWGHRSTGQKGFAQNFGFGIPDTVVIVKGKPYAWYFISKKDGSLLRKSEGSLTLGAVEKTFCRERQEGESAIAVVWLPMASQFPEARCHSQSAEFLSPSDCRDFLGGLRPSHSGIIQAFVEPHGVSNFLIRTVQYRSRTSLSVRTNRAILRQGRGQAFERCATFEGWEGLSSASGRYRCHRHPHMEELILAAGESLNERIEQERVRQMLFLEDAEHVALHFKVSKGSMLFFMYASVISEHEVVLQTRPQLLMGDKCMTDALPFAALLPGGTERKAVPYEAPRCAAAAAVVALEWQGEEGTRREGSLPPIHPSPRDVGGGEGKRRPLSERRCQKVKERTVLPRMGYTRPDVPEVPYQINPLQHSLQESGRYEYAPPFLGQDVVKRPLVTSTAALSAVLAPQSARSEPASGNAKPPLAGSTCGIRASSAHASGGCGGNGGIGSGGGVVGDPSGTGPKADGLRPTG